MTDNTEALPPLKALQQIVNLMGPAAAPCCSGCNYEWNEALRIARAALAQRQQVPEGWQLVPKVPTNEMIDAGWQKGTQAGGIQDLDEAWAAMLAAAPALTAAPSAQAEPVAPIGYTAKPLTWHEKEHHQSEQVLKVTRKPQPQHGFVHPLYAAPPTAQAKPQEPINDGLVSVAISVRDVHPESFTRGVRFAEDFHGIGKQEG